MISRECKWWYEWVPQVPPFDGRCHCTQHPGVAAGEAAAAAALGWDDEDFVDAVVVCVGCWPENTDIEPYELHF